MADPVPKSLLAFTKRGNVSLCPDIIQDVLDRFSSHDWDRPLILNDLAGSLMGTDQQIHNLMVAKVTGDSDHFGWAMLCNLPDGRQFGTVEATLLQSIATLFGTHRQNRVLYHELESLLLQFISSLVESLDAKDACTRGHSERVALIARRLGQEIGLPERDLNDIYQSGACCTTSERLESTTTRILQKNGQLTEEEFEEVKKHPEIGYNILSGLKSLRPILPGSPQPPRIVGWLRISRQAGGKIDSTHGSYSRRGRCLRRDAERSTVSRRDEREENRSDLPDRGRKTVGPDHH